MDQRGVGEAGRTEMETGGARAMKKKAKVCRFYVDGVKMAGDVLKMAMSEYMNINDFKGELKKRYHGHDVKFAVE
jgi:hypothetical protein